MANFTGTSGDDEIFGTTGDDTISGLGGNDGLYGDAGNDTLNGGDGNDFLDGYLGNDTLNGGNGNDELEGNFGNDTLTGGTGTDDFRPGQGVDVIVDFTNGVDTINVYNLGFTSFAHIMSFATQVGNNVVIAPFIDEFQLANVTINNTTLAQLDVTDFFIITGPGGTIAGTDGDDLLYGLGGNFFINLGQGGNDTIISGPTGLDRRISGGEGNDTVIITDPFVGGFVVGEAGSDTLILRPRAANSIVDATHTFNLSSVGVDIRGFEILKLESTANTAFVVNLDLVNFDMNLTQIIGGAGSDTVVTRLYNGQFPTLTFTNWSEDDTVVFEMSFVDTSLTVNGPHPGLYRIIGSNLDNTITGSGSRERIEGGVGADTLDGNGGDDTLDGGAGDDQLIGGTGNDSFIVDSLNDAIVENTAAGADTVVTPFDTYLGIYGNVENLALAAGAGALFGVGTAAANTLTGNESGNLLIAGGGDDTVNGGAGVDSLFGEAGTDTLNGDAGVDYLVGGLGNDSLNGGADADALYGEDGDDTLIGGSSFDTDILVGGDGNDILNGISGQANPDYDLMDGGAGNDTYYVDTGADLTFEGIGGGTDTVRANVTVPNAGVYLYPFVENLVLEGTTAFGVGNELANQLTGSASGNYLLGGLGNDRIAGMDGNDVLFGEGGADTFVFGAGSGQDVIGDFAIAQDVIEFASYFTSFAQAQANFVQVGNDGAIDLGGGSLIVLLGVTMANLTAANFTFPSGAEAPAASKAPPVMEALSFGFEPADTFADHGLERWQAEFNQAVIA